MVPLALKKLEIRISIEKLNFFFVHLVTSIQIKQTRDEPKTRKEKIVEDMSNLLQKVGKRKTKKVKSKTIYKNNSKAKDQVGN